MPRIASGDKSGGGFTGTVQVIADRIADEILQATEWRPEAVRVVFAQKDNPKKEFSWAVDIENPDLRPFTSNKPQGEAALRKELKGRLDTLPRWAFIKNNFINQFEAPIGIHTGYLDDFFQYTNAQGTQRCIIRIRNKEGYTSTINCPWPKIECRVGDTPEEDWLGPEKELNAGKGPFPYLIKLGLNWKQWTDVDLEQAAALWPKHYDKDMLPVEPYFQDTENLTPEILAAVHKHGLKPVQWEVVPDDDYTLSLTKDGMFYALTPIIIEGSPEDKAYQDERVVFYEMWDNLTKVIHGADARFATLAGKATPEGAQVIRGLIVPVIHQKPDIVKLFVDGEPKARLPVEHDDWRTNGLVFLDLMAERLMQADAAALCDDPAALLEWVAANMPEMADDLTIDEGEEF